MFPVYAFNLSDTLSGQVDGHFITRNSLICTDSCVFNFTGNGIEIESDGLAGGGKYINDAILQFSGSPDKSIVQQTIIVNNAQIRHSGESSFILSVNSGIDNFGEYNLLDDSHLVHSSFGTGPYPFNNFGLFRKTGGTGNGSIVNIDFAHTGTISIEAGNINFMK